MLGTSRKDLRQWGHLGLSEPDLKKHFRKLVSAPALNGAAK